MQAQSIKLTENYQKIEDVLENSGLNWFADQQELVTAAGISVSSHKALVRSDNNHVLGIVGKKYEPVQNSTAFAFMDTLVQDHKAEYEHIYLINGGSRTIIQANIGNNFTVRKGDECAAYITMINSFDRSTPFTVFFTPIRLWCTNQLSFAKKKASTTISIRHSASVMDKAEEAYKILGKATKYFKDFQAKAKALAQKTVDSKMVDLFLQECMGEAESNRKTNQHAKVKELFEKGKGNNGSSLWDLYNGVTEYADHFQIKDDEKRLASLLVGSGFNLKTKAWETALDLL